ncbi:MAG: acyl-CoA dehydrogenase family protein, partial [Brevibacterium sp.]|nr:acyl-CoA dehydrogenase family protein [Brevibacterium sp.]
MSRSTAAALPFGLTEEQQTISGMVREFADSEIAPHALAWDADHHFPVDVIKRSADLGMGGIYVSEEAGGTGMGRMDAALIFEALSTACPSVAAYISIHNMVAWMIDKYGNAHQKEKYLAPLVSMDHLGSYCLTEPNAGSDAAALRTSAREDGDSYVLNGVK